AGDLPRIICGPLVGFPITGLLGTAPRAVATHNLLQWFLDRLDIRPRHASIAPLICSMVLAIGHDVFSAVGIVLQERNGADGIHTSVERHNHRPPFAIPHSSPPHLSQAANGAVSCYARIVSPPEVDFIGRAPAKTLSNGGAAIFGECGWIKHAVRDFLVLLPCCDAKTDHVGVD